MNTKIKDNIKVLLSVCLIFAAVIVSTVLIRNHFQTNWFSKGFLSGLSMIKGTGKIFYLSCVFSSVLIFATAIVDAILKQRTFFSPILSAIAFLLTFIPFVFAGFFSFPFYWFIVVVHSVNAFALILSMRKMSRHSLGTDAGIFAFLKDPKQIKQNLKIDSVDKSVCAALFGLLFTSFLLDLALLIYHLIRYRHILFHI